MARLLILGAGIAGQTAALHAKNRLGSGHEVVVISPNSHWQFFRFLILNVKILRMVRKH